MLFERNTIDFGILQISSSSEYIEKKNKEETNHTREEYLWEKNLNGSCNNPAPLTLFVDFSLND